MVAESKWSADAKISPLQETEMKSQESEIAALVSEFEAELAEEPWNNPPALRKLRQTSDLLSKKVSGLHKMRRSIFPGANVGSVGMIPRDRPTAFAPGMAADPKKGVAPMTVEQALEQALDKKGSGAVKYTGGLIGVVHAAGVQELTKFTDHSPAKFEFIF